MCVCERMWEGERGKRALMHGLLLYDHCGTSQKNIHSLSLEVSSHTEQNQLCYRGALQAIHNVFCWWIKVEEAEYLAQIYGESLTLRTNRP